MTCHRQEKPLQPLRVTPFLPLLSRSFQSHHSVRLMTPGFQSITATDDSWTPSWSFSHLLNLRLFIILPNNMQFSWGASQLKTPKHLTEGQQQYIILPKENCSTEKVETPAHITRVTAKCRQLWAIILPISLSHPYFCPTTWLYVQGYRRCAHAPEDIFRMS